MMHLVFHCDRCGREKALDFERLGIKRTPIGVGPYDLDRASDEQWPATTRAQRVRLREKLESIAGHCRCRGAYRIDAPARCPCCRSGRYRIDPDSDLLLYD